VRCNNTRGRGRCIREGKYLYTDGIYFHRGESAAAQRFSRLHGKLYIAMLVGKTKRGVLLLYRLLYYIKYNIILYRVLYREFYKIFFDCRYNIISTLRMCTQCIMILYVAAKRGNRKSYDTRMHRYSFR